MDVVLSALVVILMVGGVLAVIGGLIGMIVGVIRGSHRAPRVASIVALLGLVAFAVGTFAGQYTA